MRSKLYKHVIWDWNGTLLDDVRLACEVLNTLRIETGLPPLDQETYQTHLCFPIKNFYATIGFDVHDTAYFERISQKYQSIYHQRTSECELHSGARELLDFFKTQGLSQSILSAHHQPLLEENLRDYNLVEYFSHIVGQDNVQGNSKIEAGKQKIQNFTHPREQILYIGDTLHDYEVASAIEVPCILVAHGHHQRERLDTAGVPVFAGFTEVKDWLCQ